MTRLDFALLLKFFELEGRFPAYPEEIPAVAVEYVAGLVKVDPALFTKYSWSAQGDQVSPRTDPGLVRVPRGDPGG